MNILSDKLGIFLERFSPVNPDDVKTDFTDCTKVLGEIELPASCMAWTDIYRNCRTLLMASISVNTEKGVDEYIETLDFVASELQWPKAFSSFLEKVLKAYPVLFEESTGNKVGSRST